MEKNKRPINVYYVNGPSWDFDISVLYSFGIPVKCIQLPRPLRF